MNLAFRVDSSNLIGAGHITRCLKLAEELRYKCNKIIFITKDLKGNFNNLIKKKKFKVVSIQSNNSTNRLKSDLYNTKKACERFGINILIVDNYQIDLKWEKEIKKCVSKLVVIDDFTEKKHYCDLIINNFSKKKYNKTKYLNGLKYVIIPNSFSYKKRVKKKSIVRIGTFFGSTDSKNCSEKFLKIFSQEEFRNFKFISILGRNNKKKNRIKKMFKEIRNFYIEKNFVNIKNFFRKIDILISAGGVTSFEALSSNIKCINVPITFYQKKSSNFQKTSKIADVFNYNKIFSRNGKQILINCINKISKKKNSISRKKYLDNLGSKRIANYISRKLLT